MPAVPRRRLTWGPGQLPTAHDVQVEVVHALACGGSLSGKMCMG